MFRAIFLLFFSLSSKIVYALPINVQSKIEKDMFLQKDEEIFLKILTNSEVNFKDAIKEISSKDIKIALTWFYFLYKEGFEGLQFGDVSSLYLQSPPLPKKDLILKKIKSFVMQKNDLKGLEDIILFYLMLENEGLLRYLSQNKITVNDLSEIIRSRNNIEILKNILFTPENEISEMLWEGRAPAALPYVLSMPDSDEKRIFLARIFFQTKDDKYRIYAEDLVKKEKFTDDGFVYDYIKYLKKTEHYKTALELLSKVKINYNNPKIEKIWSLLEELFRYYMDEKEYQKAYYILSNTKFNPQSNFLLYLRAEFLSGFVAMKFLKDNNLAIKHFENIYKVKDGNSYTKSRGAYFLARTYKNMKKTDLERKWLLIAGRYPNTFYGIMAIEELNDVEPITLLGLSQYTQNRIDIGLQKRSEIHKFYFDDLITRYYTDTLYYEKGTINSLTKNINFKIGFLFLKARKMDLANNFFAVSIADASEKEIKLGFDFLNGYIKQNKITNANAILNTFSSKAANQGVLIADAYPIVDFILNTAEISQNSLIHAIIKQESNFVLVAISRPGALGLMQVMPSTGKITSRSAGLEYNLQRLKKDYKYNIKIGSIYLDILLRQFKGMHPLALAGYNAGPNRVKTWQKRYFEPTTKHEVVDFIELIPFKETREYVLRVMENEVFYNYLLQNHTNSSLIKLISKDSSFPVFNKQNSKVQKVLKSSKKTVSKR